MPDRLPEQLAKVREAGYEGFESPLPELSPVETKGLVEGAGLGYIAQLFVESPEALQRGIERALEAGAEVVNVHAGKDWWSFQQGCEFWEAALEVAEESPRPVYFETHRGRLLNDPWSTAAYLRRFPQMRLTADFSHWTCVCESMLEDQPESLELAIAHTSLIHARVGHPEGPQVPDPRTSTWLPYVERFEAWWDRVRAMHEDRGEPVLRVDPEFGPPAYLWTDPQGDRPLADLFEVSNWMRDRLRERWEG